MLSGEERRKEILNILSEKNNPISGTDLAKKFGVSRQVIVQDIALLRAVNKNILSTNKGYVYFCQEDQIGKIRRSVKVYHKDDEILEELNCIVDYGAKVIDVVVEHEIYGQIAVDLIIRNRSDVATFVERIENSNSNGLNILTKGVHFHTIEADSEEVLDQVAFHLKEKGFLLN